MTAALGLCSVMLLHAVGGRTATQSSKAAARVDAMARTRISVLDLNGERRGTIPDNLWYESAEDPAPNPVTPILNDRGELEAYWVRGVGLVERKVVERPDFSADALAAAWVEGQRTVEGQRRLTGTEPK